MMFETNINLKSQKVYCIGTLPAFTKFFDDKFKEFATLVYSNQKAFPKLRIPISEIPI